jgi:hypothetical protein
LRIRLNHSNRLTLIALIVKAQGKLVCLHPLVHANVKIKKQRLNLLNLNSQLVIPWYVMSADMAHGPWNEVFSRLMWPATNKTKMLTMKPNMEQTMTVIKTKKGWTIGITNMVHGCLEQGGVVGRREYYSRATIVQAGIDPDGDPMGDYNGQVSNVDALRHQCDPDRLLAAGHRIA